MHRSLTVAGLLGITAVLTLAAHARDGRDVDGAAIAGTAAADAGTLVTAPAMSAARAAHTATTLLDGRVLVAGGFVAPGAPHSAELFDAARDRFVPLPPMIVSRHSHTATRLADGRVLIAGGFGPNNATLAAAELFDPATNSFRATGAMREARNGHVAVLLGDGKVLLIGGLGPNWTFLSSAELYDPATERFTPTGPLSVARESHVAVRLLDGRVLVVGGHRGRRDDMVIHASTEIYDPATGRFSMSGAMQTRRHKHDAVLLADGKVLVSAGSDERDDRGMYTSTELFDPATGSFTAGPSLAIARHKLAGSSVLLPGGQVLVSGGAAQAERYDPATRRFSTVGGDARMAGFFSAAAGLRDGRVLITGGYGNGGGPRASAWMYRPR